MELTRARFAGLSVLAASLASCSGGVSTPSDAAASRTPTVAPTRAPSVVLTRGAPAKNATCTVASCATMSVMVTGLQPTTTFTATCNAEDGKGFYSYSLTTDPSGASTTGTCFYGFPGREVWVVVGGVESNHLTWR